MKYYISIKDGRLECSWEREDSDPQQIPSYINREAVLELTQEQYENKHLYHVVDGQFVVNNEKVKAKRIREIKSRLSQIDIEAARPVRAILNKTEIEVDILKLAELELEASNLREELCGLK